jgi:thiol-disulfide isomerase/thioredoxin
VVKSACFFFVIFLFQESLAAQKQGLYPFTLTGHINGKDSGYVYLNYIPNGAMGLMDSCKLTNGNFIFKGTVTEPTIAWFETFGWNRPYEAGNVTQFYIEPGDMKLTATVHDFNNLKLSGSKSENEHKQLIQLEASTNSDMELAYDSLRTYTRDVENEKKNLADSGRLAESQRQIDSTKVQIEKLNKTLFQIDSGFIKNNPDSYVSAEWLYYQNASQLSFLSFQDMYGNLSERIKQSFPGKKIKFEIEKEKNMAVGTPVQLFTAIDSKGDTIRLADYKNKKYVLLDFGASWCSPCRQIIPSLKKEYSKYLSSLEIISIANQDEEDQWWKAVADDKLEWPQIIENSKKRPLEPVSGSISDSYYISTIPSLILIDKNLRIIGKYGGFFASKPDYIVELDQKLKELHTPF